jgi:3-oxo-4-pregnene-20-carboxyl-CoA dehydrogenase beta subunit
MNRHDVDRSALPGSGERACLRERLRSLLALHWPAPGAGYRAGQPAAVAALWRHLAADGIAALGAQPARGGLREAAIALEEIGRAGCAVPLLGHLLGNLVLARADGAPFVDVHVRERLHGGALRMTIAFALEDDAADALSLRAGRATGLLHGVDAALQATHVLVCAPDGLLVADLGSPGVSVIGADETAGASCADVRLEEVGVDLFALASATLNDLRLLAGLLAVARSQGAAQRELDWVRVAGQVGGSLEPHLAARLSSLDRLNGAVERAAEAFDFGLPLWREQAAAAAALGADVLDPTSGRRAPLARRGFSAQPASP